MEGIVIRRYGPPDAEVLRGMLQDEGEDWAEYHSPEAWPRYARALASSVVYVAFDGDTMCGYARCREDDGFGVYVYDLLVRSSHRGHGLGRDLMAQVCVDFPDQTVYVNSDVDGYYTKLGYRREGSIFVVTPPA